MKYLLILPIRLYQVVIAPWMPPVCRFEPTCSHYSLGAIRKHGLFKGGWLMVRRLLRCQPWGGEGFDPVP